MNVKLKSTDRLTFSFSVSFIEVKMCSKGDSKCCKSLPDSQDQIRSVVREHYGSIVSDTKTSRCCSSGGSCFGANTTENYAEKLGYTKEDLAAVPDGANLGLGCGNPLAFAMVKPGDTVLDLGSGAGFDAFIAARKVGPQGLVIGVDMTPAMISKAREKAEKGNFANVSFRLGEIEHLPVADSTVDLIISNCVLNLSPAKRQVLAECFRVLKPGGRVVISDIVTEKPLPPEVRNDLAMYAGCLAGATLVADLQTYFNELGYVGVNIEKKPGSDELIGEWALKAGQPLGQYVYSAIIQAQKHFI